MRTIWKVIGIIEIDQYYVNNVNTNNSTNISKNDTDTYKLIYQWIMIPTKEEKNIEQKWKHLVLNILSKMQYSHT